MADEVVVSGTSRNRTEIIRYLVGVAVGIVVLLLLFGKRNELGPAWHQVRQANLGWVAAGIGAEALSLLTFAVMQHRVLRLSGSKISLGSLMLLSLANDAIANTVPGEPAISSAYRFRFYRRQGTTSASAGWTIFTILVAQAIGMSLLLLLGVLVALASGGIKDAGASIAGLVIVIIAVAVLVRRDLILRLVSALTRLVQRIITRGRDAKEGGLAERIQATLARMREIPLSTGSTVGIAGLATAVWFGDFLCLVCGFAATGAAIPWDGVLLAYGVAQVAGTLPIVPGGIGIIEGSLAIILIGFGASRPSALAAAVIYRAISFWLAIAVGWSSVWVIAHRHRRS
ncbi:MAG TPA: YbhN family protein [Streptosporangiaceae bacterium]|nr:YbhN family protein [Streptosporangiaceae bacterium]